MTDFADIKYKGKSLERDVNAGVTVAYYRHIYRTNINGTIRQHKCLQWGAWCWKQAGEHPLTAIKYLLGRKLQK